MHSPHEDALVIRTIVDLNGLKRKLVDNGSLVNVIFGATFDKMEVDQKLNSMTSPLYEFTGDIIVPRGKITVAIEMGMHNSSFTILLNFWWSQSLYLPRST